MTTTETNKEKQETTASKAPPKHKWLSRIGNFMMMGGFLLVLVVGVAIAIGVSILLNR